MWGLTRKTWQAAGLGSSPPSQPASCADNCFEWRETHRERAALSWATLVPACKWSASSITNQRQRLHDGLCSTSPQARERPRGCRERQTEGGSRRLSREEETGLTVKKAAKFKDKMAASRRRPLESKVKIHMYRKMSHSPRSIPQIKNSLNWADWIHLDNPISLISHECALLWHLTTGALKAG